MENTLIMEENTIYSELCESLFWLVYRNIYLRRVIFRFIEEYEPKNYYIGNKIKLNLINSLDFMIDRSLYALIKDKVVSSSVITISKYSILKFVKNCQDYALLKLFFNSKINFINKYYELDLILLSICFGNRSLLSYLLEIDYDISVNSIVMTLQYSTADSIKSLYIRSLNQLAQKIHLYNNITFFNNNSNNNNNNNNNNINYLNQIINNNKHNLRYISNNIIKHLSINNSLSNESKVKLINELELVSKLYFPNLKLFTINMNQLEMVFPHSSFSSSSSSSSSSPSLFSSSSVPPVSTTTDEVLVSLISTFINYEHDFNSINEQNKFIKMMLCIRSNHDVKLYIEYFFQYDEIIQGSNLSIVYLYTFSTFSISGLLYLLQNFDYSHILYNQTPDKLLKDIKYYFSIYKSLNIPNIPFKRIYQFLSIYLNQKVVYFSHWDIYCDYLFENYPLEMFELLFSPNSQYYITIDNSLINSLLFRKGILPFWLPPSFGLVQFNSGNIIISNYKQVQYILNNLHTYNFGHILISPNIASLDLAVYFDLLFCGVPKLLIYSLVYFKSIFIDIDIQSVIRIEGFIYDFDSSNTLKVDPFLASDSLSNSFQNLSKLLNELIVKSIQKTKRKNIIANCEGYIKLSISDSYSSNKYFSKSNFFKDFLNNTESNLLKLIIKKSIKQLFKRNDSCGCGGIESEVENDEELPIKKFEKIINHLASSNRTNTIVFNTLLNYVYYQFSTNDIQQITITTQFFHQELLDLFVILLFNKEIGKATHILRQINDYKNLYVSKVMNVYVNWFLEIEGESLIVDNKKLELDDEIDALEIVDLIHEIFNLVPSKKMYIFQPLLQQLFNYLCSSHSASLDLIGQAIDLFKLHISKVDLKVGVYHIFYFLNLKNKKLMHYFLNKPFNSDVSYNYSNDYNGTMKQSNLFNQHLDFIKCSGIEIDPEVLLITIDHGISYQFQLNFDTICSLDFDTLIIIIRNLVSEIPLFTHVFSGDNQSLESIIRFNFVSYAIDDNLNNDILYFFSIHQYEYGIKLFNNYIQDVDNQTIKQIISIHPAEIVANIILTKDNINQVVMSCINYRRFDIIYKLFNNIDTINNKNNSYLLLYVNFNKILRKYMKLPRYENYYDDINQIVRFLLSKLSIIPLLFILRSSIDCANVFVGPIAYNNIIRIVGFGLAASIIRQLLTNTISNKYYSFHQIETFVKNFRLVFGDQWDNIIKEILKDNYICSKKIFNYTSLSYSTQ